jgi:hypothetical protein
MQNPWSLDCMYAIVVVEPELCLLIIDPTCIYFSKPRSI